MKMVANQQRLILQYPIGSTITTMTLQQNEQNFDRYTNTHRRPGYAVRIAIDDM